MRRPRCHQGPGDVSGVDGRPPPHRRSPGFASPSAIRDQSRAVLLHERDLFGKDFCRNRSIAPYSAAAS